MSVWKLTTDPEAVYPPTDTGGAEVADDRPRDPITGDVIVNGGRAVIRTFILVDVITGAREPVVARRVRKSTGGFASGLSWQSMTDDTDRLEECLSTSLEDRLVARLVAERAADAASERARDRELKHLTDQMNVDKRERTALRQTNRLLEEQLEAANAKLMLVREKKRRLKTTLKRYIAVTLAQPPPLSLPARSHHSTCPCVAPSCGRKPLPYTCPGNHGDVVVYSRCYLDTERRVRDLRTNDLVSADGKLVEREVALNTVAGPLTETVTAIRSEAGGHQNQWFRADGNPVEPINPESKKKSRRRSRRASMVDPATSRRRSSTAGSTAAAAPPSVSVPPPKPPRPTTAQTPTVQTPPPRRSRDRAGSANM